MPSRPCFARKASPYSGGGSCACESRTQLSMRVCLQARTYPGAVAVHLLWRRAGVLNGNRVSACLILLAFLVSSV
jgi:hypothetical protein